jgi:Protein of unknown function (DUF2911)
MKIKLFTLLFVLASLSFQAQIKTPAPSPGAKVEQKVGLTDVTLEYSRPSMRNRTIFGDLVPFGKLWRTGANARTKITFSTDVTIDNKELKAGTYAIFTIPNKDSWEIVFYTEYAGAGAPSELDESKVALKTTSKVHPLGFPMETYTMGFGDLADGNSGMLYIMWEKTSVGIKIEVPTEEIAMKSIDKVLAGPSANDYFGAGSYYFSTGKDLKKALEWVNKAVEMSPKAFWMTRQKSLIQAKMGDKKGAIETAKISLEVSQKAGNDDYIKMNKESIAEWSK